MGEHHSALGGLWLDLNTAPAMIELEREAGRLSVEQARRLEDWRRDGLIHLPGAVSADLADDLNSRIDELWAAQDPRLRASVRGFNGDLPTPLAREHQGLPGTKLLDLHWHEPAARALLLNAPIASILRLLFRQPPLLFQSLSFHRGSQQWIHQDSAYVVVDAPLEMAAVWVALEDWRPGCGELRYYPGSHRMPEFLFGAKRKDWIKEIDGHAAHEEWARALPERAAAAGCVLRELRPRKGDAVFWHADLAHGGAPITDPSATRRSIVGHFCPAGRKPLSGAREKGPRRAHEGSWYSSGVYEARDSSVK